MANTKSAIKSNRQAAKRRTRNRAALSGLRTAIKRIRTAADSGDGATAAGLLSATFKLIDASAGKRVIPRRRADRTKARLARAVAAATAAPSAG